MFTAPQFLSRVRHRKECFILPAKLQCGQSRQKRFLVFACVLSRQGPGSVLTTSSATVQCGAHGNSAFKEWRKASGMERKRHEMSRNRVKNLFLPLCLIYLFILFRHILLDCCPSNKAMSNNSSVAFSFVMLRMMPHFNL